MRTGCQRSFGTEDDERLDQRSAVSFFLFLFSFLTVRMTSGWCAQAVGIRMELKTTTSITYQLLELIRAARTANKGLNAVFYIIIGISFGI